MRRYPAAILLLLLAANAQADKVLYFWQPSCVECPAQNTVVDYVNNQGYAIEKVNAAERTDLVQEYRVPRTPWFVAVDDSGKQVGVIGRSTTSPGLLDFAKRFARKAAKLSPVCLVRCVGDSPNSKFVGSGTLISDDGEKGIVLTCSHTFKDGRKPYEIMFADGRKYTAEILADDTEHELTALEIRSPGIAPLFINLDGLDGELSAGGFGGDIKGWRAVKGRVVSGVNYQNPAWREMRGVVRQGDSGGPVLTERNELCGVLWGTGQGQTIFATGQPLRRFLNRIVPNRVQPVVLKPVQGYGSPGGTGSARPPSDINPGLPVEPSPGPAQPMQPPQQPRPPVDPGPTLDQETWHQVEQEQFDALGKIQSDISVLVQNPCKCDNTKLLAVLNQQTNLLTTIVGRLDNPDGEPAATPQPVYFDIRPRPKGAK